VVRENFRIPSFSLEHGWWLRNGFGGQVPLVCVLASLHALKEEAEDVALTVDVVEAAQAGVQPEDGRGVGGSCKEATQEIPGRGVQLRRDSMIRLRSSPRSLRIQAQVH
jgi:hypothetical protein